MVTVNNVKVRSEEVVNLEIQFYELTEDGQKRIFNKKKQDFVRDALRSEYPSVRKFLWEIKEKCSSIVLNMAIEECLKINKEGVRDNYVSGKDIIDLLNVPDFRLDNKLRVRLAESGDWTLKRWVARDSKTPLNILKSTLMFELAATRVITSKGTETDLFDEIICNRNFWWCRDMERIMKKYSWREAQMIVLRIKELDPMWLKEGML